MENSPPRERVYENCSLTYIWRDKSLLGFALVTLMQPHKFLHTSEIAQAYKNCILFENGFQFTSPNLIIYSLSSRRQIPAAKKHNWSQNTGATTVNRTSIGTFIYVLSMILHWLSITNELPHQISFTCYEYATTLIRYSDFIKDKNIRKELP